MLDLLLNHSPAFVGGELLLALSLGVFGFALSGAAREKYSVRIPLERMRNRLTSLRPTFGGPRQRPLATEVTPGQARR
jgi:hypothetical protein